MAAERRPLTAEEIAGIEALTEARTVGTLYDVLGIPPFSDPKAVEEAYHALARRWHPDRFYSRDVGDLRGVLEENFVAATRAFRTLRDPVKRSAYHREAGLQEGSGSASAPPAEPSAPRSGETLLPGGTVSASNTSPGGTRVYETIPRPLDLGRRQTAPPPPPPPKPKAPPAVQRIREQIAEQLAKARQCFLAGKADLEAGRYAKAESALYLACKYDPKNEEFRALYDVACARAKEGRAKGFIQQAEQEESYQKVKEAIALYVQATECDPPEGLAYYRLARLLRLHEHDARGAVANLRKAVTKEPENTTFRLELAEVYVSLNLHANAIRELQGALTADPSCAPAKAMLKKLKR